MNPEIHEWQALSDTRRVALLERPVARDDARIRAGARDIIAQVRRDGDTALAALTAELDGAALDDFRVTDGEFDAARRALAQEARNAIDLAIDNVRRFHEAQRPRTITVETMPGIRCERISQPLDSVGLYVPAGTAPLRKR